jgi:hypothetical protein
MRNKTADKLIVSSDSLPKKRRGQRIVDLTGRRFHRLIVLGFAGIKNKNSSWTCLCRCSKVVVVYGTNLVRDHVQSCGCLHRDRARIMGRKNARIQQRLRIGLFGRTHKQHVADGRKGGRHVKSACLGIFSPEQMADRFRRGRTGMHSRWHAARKIVNPKCDLCCVGLSPAEIAKLIHDSIPVKHKRGRKMDDLTGRKFARLTVIRFVEMRNHRAVWLCQCRCGHFVEVTNNNLIQRATRSCGCLCIETLRARLTSRGK